MELEECVAVLVPEPRNSSLKLLFSNFPTFSMRFLNSSSLLFEYLFAYAVKPDISSTSSLWFSGFSLDWSSGSASSSSSSYPYFLALLSYLVFIYQLIDLHFSWVMQKSKILLLISFSLSSQTFWPKVERQDEILCKIKSISCEIDLTRVVMAYNNGAIKF